MNKILLTVLFLTTLSACTPHFSSVEKLSKHAKDADKNERENRSDIAEAMDQWSLTRSFPDNNFPAEKLEIAYNQRELQLLRESDPLISLSPWRSLGPANVAGRTLCLAFHPTDSMVMWAGSASGGLWKTTTGGIGPNAWQRVKMGFPVLGVSSIAVSPDAQTIFIGTGEVYGYRNSIGSVGIRLQRGSYGIGILKSTDGGITWSKSMDWVQNNLRGVQKIILNPRRSSTVFAATTEGVYRSYDAGQNWTLVNATPMAVDLDIVPTDTNRIFCTFGSLNNPQNGIFRSLNGGTNWTKLTVGLPTNYTGKTLLTIAPSQSNTLYASVADAETQIGLYKSTNGGDSWTLMNNDNVANYQGWYSHDVAVHPQNPNFVIHIGINAVMSTDAGVHFSPISNSYDIPFGRDIAPASAYMHADMHAVYFSPFNPNKAYFVTDGGIYKNDNVKAYLETFDLHFDQLNGGLQTTQFYANFSNSQQDSSFAIGGMQDNWTAIYEGQPNWRRCIGGDGTCTAIHPKNDSILFGAYQYLGILRSTDRGTYFSGTSFTPTIGATTFNAPYVFAPSNPNIMYAGSEKLLRSNDGGQTFLDYTPTVDSSNSINVIAVNPKRENTVFFATFPTVTSVAKLFKTTNSGATRVQATGLPNRIFTDIEIHPVDTNIVFTTLGGFGSVHLYKSNDAGLTWQVAGNGLPDVPTNTVLLDTISFGFVYVGNDLGVYLSTDGGANFRPLSNSGLPEACVVMDLSLSPKNRKLRAATHGNGVFETNMAQVIGISDPLGNVQVTANIATTNEQVRADFIFKNVKTDTILGTISDTRLGYTLLPVLRPIVLDYPYPHPLAAPFVDSNFTIKLTPARLTKRNLHGGTTTLDLAIIARNILGTDTSVFNNPYKMVAADISGDGAVDGVDMLLLRRFILNVDSQFRFVPHWVYIPKTYTLPANPPRLSELPQWYFLNPNAVKNPSPFQFWAIKMGDVNNSFDVTTDGFRASPLAQVETRSEGLVLATENIYVEAGSIYDINIKPSKPTTCMGFQGCFSFQNAANTEGVEFLNLESSTLENFNETNFNASKNGQLAFSWNAVNNQIFDAKTTLLTLKIKAKKSGYLSEILQLNSDLTPALSFDEKGIEKALGLTFDTPNSDLKIEAEPNPFSTILNVKIGQNTEGVLRYSIFDNSGKLIYKNQENGKKGETILRLNAASIHLINAGIYFLKIETNNESKTIKIVKI